MNDQKRCNDCANCVLVEDELAKVKRQLDFAVDFLADIHISTFGEELYSASRPESTWIKERDAFLAELENTNFSPKQFNDIRTALIAAQLSIV